MSRKIASVRALEILDSRGHPMCLAPRPIFPALKYPV
jgi:hypothetical protein